MKTTRRKIHWTNRMAALAVLVVVVVITQLLAGACSKGNPDAFTGATPADVQNVFPHADDYARADVHGEDVLSDGVDLCRECHGTDFAGSWSKVSCYTCHAAYPHAWTGHGDYVANNGLETCATQCHGSDLDGGDSGVSCFNCHGEFE